MSDDAIRAETLLARYPELSEVELAELIDIFRKLPLLHFGLIASDDTLSPRLDAFYRNHRDALRPPLSWIWTAIAAVVAGAALVVVA